KPHPSEGGEWTGDGRNWGMISPILTFHRPKINGGGRKKSVETRNSLGKKMFLERFLVEISILLLELKKANLNIFLNRN
ncbi:MAG: hypothetical protein Q4E67_08105, partial [Planctomycetia bacterium]|nr:hypothetical protein [Planctomycetia bacterium]